MRVPTPSVSIAELREVTVMPVWRDDPCLPSLASALGVSRGKAYEVAQSGLFPVVRLTEHRILIPVPAFLRWLGDEPDRADAADAQTA